MAEKYGTVPKKFTSAWWSYIWEYYKWYIIVPTAIALFIIWTVAAKLNAPKYDMNLLYAGNGYISSEQSDALCDALSGYIDDTDGDGASIYFSQLNFSDSADSIQTDTAYSSKLFLEFTGSDTMIMLVDSARAEMLIESDTYQGSVMSVSDWADSMPSESLLYSYDGVPYAVNLSESGILNSCGILGKDMYVIVRLDFTGEDYAAVNQSQAVKAANALIK